MEQFFDNIDWSPGIGDPSFVGWFTVAAYFFSAFQCVRVVQYSERIFYSPVARQTRLWCVIAVAMFLLGVNKQLDLQSFFTATARYMAISQGWYDHRRALQEMFIYTIMALGAGVVIILVIAYVRVIKNHLVAIIGLSSLVAFVLIRASSFHNMDTLISQRVMGVYVNWVLELGGIALITYNAIQLYARRRPLIDLNELQKNFTSNAKP